VFADLLATLDRGEACVWVAVAGVRGSAPRESDAGMLVTAQATLGTIGGGHLEWKAIEFARECLELRREPATRRHYPLGPALGQCCGGAVDLLYRPVSARHRPWVAALAAAERAGGDLSLATRLDAGPDHTVLGAESSADVLVTRHAFDPWLVWVFGAGHVGRALVQVLATLPCRITLIDARDQEFPASLPPNVVAVQADHPQDEAIAVPARADVLVLTHSHALDLAIVRVLLCGTHAGFLGVIGSATKAALFRRRLSARGVPPEQVARMTCPIGERRFADKRPGSIAIDVAACLWQRRLEERGRSPGPRTEPLMHEDRQGR
jgi:xanthine dehydrogenase accessory factor